MSGGKCGVEPVEHDLVSSAQGAGVGVFPGALGTGQGDQRDGGAGECLAGTRAGSPLGGWPFEELVPRYHASTDDSPGSSGPDPVVDTEGGKRPYAIFGHNSRKCNQAAHARSAPVIEVCRLHAIILEISHRNLYRRLRHSGSIHRHCDAP